MKRPLLLLVLLFSFSKNFATCPSGFSEVVVQIIPDAYPQEISWKITDIHGTIIASGDSLGDTLCVDTSQCYTFQIHDAFGDGIFGPGGYWLFINGTLFANGNNYGYGEQHSFYCPHGENCSDPAPLSFGAFTAPFEDTWYSYTPTVTGKYLISTCGIDSCDTKIWVYSSCPSQPYNEGVPGTYAYNDDFCSVQSSLNFIMTAGTTYYIRIGDNINSCTSTIDFEFSYFGPIQGCTDISACNYNPLATVDDGSCMYPPNPLCTGPDLQIDSTQLIQTLYLMQHTADNCDVTEGCVTGYGDRHVITFSSKVNNIGTIDFYIGTEMTQPGMFNINNCHGHAHYEGYGDYRLFDSNNNLVPAGHKNGFCVMDLCGTGQYNCGDMGISSGCYDEYGAGTQCQWLDITDVPTGDYRIAVIINSKHLPDALGRFETNYLNNATQVCLHIDHNTGAAPTYYILPTCTPFVDCAGLPGGSSIEDCNGVCNGQSVFGDVFPNAALDSQDVFTYLDLLQAQYPATLCNDLNRDSSLSIYDASLVNWCRIQTIQSGSTHNHCNFPRNILNPNDSATLSIQAVNFIDHYVDVSIRNTVSKVKAYQFTMHGIDISSVVSLASPLNFPIDVRFITATNEVIGISLQDSSMGKYPLAQPLVRIYFNAITDTLICIDKITDIVNENAERILAKITGTCQQAQITTGISDLQTSAGIAIIPNPANEKAFIHFNNNSNSSDFLITDVTGKIFSVPRIYLSDSWYEVDLSKLSSGIYFVVLNSDGKQGVGRFVKM